MILPSKSDKNETKVEVQRYAETDLPTRHGTIRTVVYRVVKDGQADTAREHVALLFGNAIEGGQNVLLRVHSECLTSEVFGSLKCDCNEQLEAAIETCATSEAGGIIIYLRQEGRGIGLGNKIRAYALQAKGADTVEANHQLGFEADQRTYDIAGLMLRNLGIESVRLMTNNPRKVRGLEESGISVTERLSVKVPPNLHSAVYLATKREKLGHYLDVIAPSPERAADIKGDDDSE